MNIQIIIVVIIMLAALAYVGQSSGAKRNRFRQSRAIAGGLRLSSSETEKLTIV